MDPDGRISERMSTYIVALSHFMFEMICKRIYFHLRGMLYKNVCAALWII